MAYDKKKIKAEYGAFVKQYGRKKHSGHDPNDRQYSRKLEMIIKSMKPEDLRDLLEEEDN